MSSLQNQISNAKNLAVIAEISKQVGEDKLGRTSLMKLLYFLQELAHVPLNYSFSIYSYGPFDAEVLSDLGDAEQFGFVKSNIHYYPGGYGYKISPGGREAEILEGEAEFLNTYRENINSIVSKFSAFSPSDLELLSTIHFAFEEASLAGPVTVEQLAGVVKRVKPKFDQEYILKSIGTMVKLEAIRPMNG
jgi:hypothetical protein